ncbi:probable threonine protease PRSS50 [Erinaceus europaeus]|uniref:Probable threonine protease PRSS50 n=1 Tax=Erinaceus europaeus TaxID=9365 RepID=A0ABM3YIJ1_ERIEU|nr:probable threonine protease PRSS50 [Erinaceus europaeus]
MALGGRPQALRRTPLHPPALPGPRAALLLLLLLLLQPLLRPMGEPRTRTRTRTRTRSASPQPPGQHPRPAPLVSPTPGPDPEDEDEDDFFPTCGKSYEPDITLTYPEAVARRWPWMVSVRANGVHICAGAIIAHRWVLTIAHCLTQSDAVYSVRAGSPWVDRTASTGSDIPVEQVIVNRQYRSHRRWSWVGRVQDLGLLKLQQNLSYSRYIWPICLPDSHFVLKDKSHCTVTGWGLPNANGLLPQFRTLQEKEVTVMNRKECDNFYHKFSKVPALIRIVTAQMMCIQDQDREKFCYERSGEPLVCSVEGTWLLMGIMSWGPGCNESAAPLIFLRTTSYKPWIWEVLSGQPPPAQARALLLALLLPLGLLAAR